MPSPPLGGEGLFIAITTIQLTLTGLAHAQGPVGETGTVTLTNTIDQNTVITVTLINTYADPVVVAFINTRAGANPLTCGCAM